MASTGRDSDPAAVPPDESMANARLKAAVAVFALVALAIACLAIPALRHAISAALHGNIDLLRVQLLALGPAGVAVLVGLVLSHTVVPFPAELPTAVAGFVYGFAAALPLMAVSFLASALIGYALARWAGRPLARRVVGARRLAEGERLVARGGARVLLALRLIPLMPFSLVCFACGLARVPARRYTWTTIVGMLPQLALVSLLASRLQHPSASDPLVWSSGLAFVLLVVAGPPLLRRLRAAHA